MFCVKKKILVALGVVFGIICCYFLLGIFGNPVSKHLVTTNAKEYIQAKWPDENYSIESVQYDFKTSNYYVSVKAPDSVDNGFTLYGGLNGEITFDTYDTAVVKKWNTANRINEEYGKSVEKAFNNGKFKYSSDIAFGEIEFADSDYADEVPEYAIYTDSLVLDADYDPYDMGKKAGCLTIYVYDNNVSAEKLAEILLDIKEYMDEEKVGFRGINCILQPPKNEDGIQDSENRVEVMRFLYEDIYADGLVDRVKVANEKAQEYYENMTK